MSAASGAGEEKSDGPWLHAWYDPVAGLKTFSQCVRLADLAGDGDYRLLVADHERRLKIFKGTGVASVHSLLDVPSSIACFYPEATTPRIPSVAVASGPFVYIYRNLRPYMKFTCPQVALAHEEVSLWDEFWANKVDLTKLLDGLTQMRDVKGLSLSSRGVDILALCDEKVSKLLAILSIMSSDCMKISLQERNEYIGNVRGRPLLQHTIITCMEVINRDRDGAKEVSSLILGTESKQLLFLDPTCTSIEAAFTLPSIPTHLAVHGLLAVDYRVNIACRDGAIYAIKDRQLMSTKIECESLPCGMVRTEPELYVGTIDSRLHSFHVKGKKNWSLSLPAPITAMAKVTLTRTDSVSCCAIALEGGEVRIYNGKVCVASLIAPDTITALQFGVYSREANTLVTVSRSGALTFKMTKRGADFKVAEAPSGPPAEQDIPLAVPKKTKLYVEQTQRERDQASEMHRLFQRDLCKLRLNTARAFVKTIADGGSALASLSGASIRLNASVVGLGPNFKVKLDLTNVGSHVAYDVFLFFSFKVDMYIMRQPFGKIALLIPGVRYQFEFPVVCIDPLGRADAIRCFVMKGASTSPAINAIINMPMSQPIPVQ